MLTSAKPSILLTVSVTLTHFYGVKKKGGGGGSQQLYIYFIILKVNWLDFCCCLGLFFVCLCFSMPPVILVCFFFLM